MNSRTMKHIALHLTFTVLLLWGLSEEVFASCTKSPALAGPVTWTLPPSISINRNTPVGTVLYTQAWNNSGGPYVTTSNCNPSFYTYNQLVNSMPTTAVPNAYATNVPGIGVRIWGNAGTSQYLPAYPNLSNKQGPYSSGTIISQGFGFDLVVTGQVGIGTLTFSNGNVAESEMSDSGTNTLVNPYVYQYLQINGSTNIVSSGCTTQNVTATLSNVAVASLGGKPVGTTFNPRPFNISMSCNTGVKVSYQIDGASSVYSQPNGVLNNSTGTGMATGVGVQILAGTGDNPPPLPLSTKTLVITTTSSNQPVSIPLVAQYYKTAMTVSPGQVQVLATFTMYYE